ncbi:SURF1 family protein [Methylotenera versatilis]|uniref:SURF1 family protein n=1 Tax=Methylotenera versatilis TaxID=1055487 RepID=UPI000AF965EB|nr:SURF1 family protein [Methylotenera versatilis]
MSTLLTIICIPLFIKLGFWQYEKAQLKLKIQASFEASNKNKTPDLKDYLSNSSILEFKKIQVQGEYKTQYQILIDNKVENSLVGYHVVTPLKIVGTDEYVLVNRGWVQGEKDRADLPTFETPTGILDIQGMAWIPSQKIFTLEDKAQIEADSKTWQPVWQNLDMQKYVKNVPIKILPIIIKLDHKSAAGGFVRNWEMSQERIVTHLGYAYQWFGFAFATFMIYLYLSISKRKKT